MASHPQPSIARAQRFKEASELVLNALALLLTARAVESAGSPRVEKASDAPMGLDSWPRRCSFSDLGKLPAARVKRRGITLVF
jgi:hypothetical protein